MISSKADFFRKRLPFACFSSIGCPEKSLSEVLELADRHGLDFVEIRTLRMREDLPALLVEEHGDPSAVDEIFSRYQARPLIWGSSYKLVGNEGIAGLETAIPWLGPYKWLRVIDGGKFGQTLTDEEIERGARRMAWMNKQFESSGLMTRVIIETHDVFANPVECRRVMDATGGNIDLLWDSHHTWRPGGFSPREAWGMLGPWTRHIHIKDSRGDKRNFKYALPGRGDFDLGELLAILKEKAYSGTISLEWEKRWHPELPPIEAAFEAYAALGPDAH
jgi:sugar phosphate isomerase/epimerase